MANWSKLFVSSGQSVYAVILTKYNILITGTEVETSPGGGKQTRETE